LKGFKARNIGNSRSTSACPQKRLIKVIFIAEYCAQLLFGSLQDFNWQPLFFRSSALAVCASRKSHMRKNTTVLANSLSTMKVLLKFKVAYLFKAR
jgi:hypothetical protein